MALILDIALLVFLRITPFSILKRVLLRYSIYLFKTGNYSAIQGGVIAPT